jgi:hypothetical protein
MKVRRDCEIQSSMRRGEQDPADADGEVDVTIEEERVATTELELERTEEVTADDERTEELTPALEGLTEDEDEEPEEVHFPKRGLQPVPQ